MNDPETDPSWNPLAALCAWLVPGLGHWMIGQKQRAAVLATSIGGLWLIGILIGGIGVVNVDNNKWWFMGQMLCAPSVAVQGLHQFGLADRAPGPGESTKAMLTYEQPFGRAEEQGTLFTALAGLLNLLAVIDVIYREERQHEHNAAPASPKEAQAQSGGAS